MAVLTPFRALRPEPSAAPTVASVPYDVVNTEEARALAAENPLSFLRVTRAEVDLPVGADPHGPSVYAQALSRFFGCQQAVWASVGRGRGRRSWLRHSTPQVGA